MGQLYDASALFLARRALVAAGKLLSLRQVFGVLSGTRWPVHSRYWEGSRRTHPVEEMRHLRYEASYGSYRVCPETCPEIAVPVSRQGRRYVVSESALAEALVACDECHGYA